MFREIDPNSQESMRRSMAMLPDQPSGLHRERAQRIVSELQSLQRSDWRQSELMGQLRALLDGLEQAGC
jgi:hypothetical protein